MRKIIIMAMLAMAIGVSSPLMPVAHAATANDVLAQIMAQNPKAAQVQELLALKQDIEQGGRGAIVSRVTQAALDRVGQGELAGLVGSAANGGEFRAAVETAVRQEVTAQLAAKFGPYEDSLNLLATLLQNAGLIPQTVRDSNSLAAGGQILQ
ncbi:hypothetical protein [Anaeroselena agilis]|uniref:Uncharacterized protein n=1 Tax=Anaeroselena agilis TaxID=3063788 RepID=A0ABU3NVM8_9FIRM|nr:hypothetical protein [Selenomonadales bacterium 4137-cl]